VPQALFDFLGCHGQTHYAPPRAYLILLAARWLLHTGLHFSLATSGSLNWLKKIHASCLDHLV
jgi:hypothetical protein